MRQSELFTKTLKEVPKRAVFINHQLLVKGGFIYQFASGIYALLPLGFAVFRRIESIIREEFDKMGIQELRMPLLHPVELWKRTGRWETAGKELWKIKSRKGEEMVLAMTHEETISAIASQHIKTERGLPFIVNQFSTKVRDEERPRGGLIRLREFVMQDAYSFDKDERGLDTSFQKMIKAYKKIFKKMELPIKIVKASTGVMGGLDSCEFMVVAESGEDKIGICPECKTAVNLEMLKNKENCPQCRGPIEVKRAIEVAHLFKLGDKYSRAMNILYRDRKGKKHFVQMGCYGIGLERVMAAIVEVSHDEKGIIWPACVAPFDIHLLALGSKKESMANEIKKTSEKLYCHLHKKGVKVLYDDREDKTAGEKFADCDLIGIPTRIVISERTLRKKCLEIKKRNKKVTRLVKIDQLAKIINNVK